MSEDGWSDEPTQRQSGDGGPPADGRYKPDVVASGERILFMEQSCVRVLRREIETADER